MDEARYDDKLSPPGAETPQPHYDLGNDSTADIHHVEGAGLSMGEPSKEETSRSTSNEPLSRTQEAELITAVQGRGEVPLKFTYLGEEGAQNWDHIARERTEGEGINSAEGALLQKRVGDFLSTLQIENGVNIVDIGCGNGAPTFPILKRLTDTQSRYNYVPMDISQAMLELATRNVGERFPGTTSKPIKADFELGQFAEAMYDLKKEMPVNLLLFLGSTLGNHSDLNRVLTNFRDSMTSRDYLILGVEMTNLTKVKHLIPHYQNEAVERLATHTLDYLSIPKDAYSYTPSWNEKKSQIEMRAEMNRDIEVNFAGEKFTLKGGESLLLGRSIKFTESSVTQLLSDVSLRTELLTTSPDRGYLLAMVQPTRYSV